MGHGDDRGGHCRVVRMIGQFAHDETNGFDAIDRKAPQDSRPRAGRDGISVDLAIP